MALDRQTAFTGTAPADLAAEPLGQYLAGVVPGFAGPLTVRRYKGGQSNPTYELVTPDRRYVLRRKPDGPLLASAHAVDREFRLLGALHPTGFPVPEPLHLCLDRSIAGTEFYLMSHVDGRLFWMPHAPGLGATERAQLFANLCDTLVLLHRQPLGPLEGFGRPEGYVRRQVRRWSEQYRQSATRVIPAMDRLIVWLAEAAPESGRHAIVHGDYRLDNCIVAPDRPAIAAVLDWELATLGDPIADFTYHLMMWDMPVVPGGAGVGSLIGHERDPGVPERTAYIARYAEAMGLPGIESFDIYLAYNFFRLAAILQGIIGRVRDGTAANPRALAMADAVEPLAETGWHFARKAGA